MRTGRRVIVRAAVLAALLAGAVAAALLMGVPDVAGLGAPAFVLAYAALTLLPLPRNVLSVATGLAFGIAGTGVAVAGSLLGAVAGFGLGRLLGREAVERFAGERVARIDALLARRGVVAVLVARLLPVVPFTGTNYAAGVSAVRFRDFLLGTAIGIVPGTVAYVALGAYGTSPTSWPFAAVVAALLVLSLGGSWLASRRDISGRGASLHPARVPERSTADEPSPGPPATSDG